MGQTFLRTGSPDSPHVAPTGEPVASPQDLVVTGTFSVATEHKTEATFGHSVATKTKNEATERLSEATESIAEATELISEATKPGSEVTESPSEVTECVSEATKTVSEATEMIFGVSPEGFHHSARRCATQEALRRVTSLNISNPERVLSATQIREMDSTLSGLLLFRCANPE